MLELLLFFNVLAIIVCFTLPFSILVSCVVVTNNQLIIKYNTIKTTTTNNTVNPSSGEAGNASSYAAAIKANVVKIQDELLVSKYRKDYETAIINLDDYIGYLMIKQTLNMNLNGDMKSNITAINNLNTLKGSKDALNATMAFLDKQ